MSRILVVDDDASLAWIAKASLTRFGGHDVTTTRSVRDARAALAAERFDAILLDAMMPDEDGGSLLRALQDDEALRAIPVVMLTARIGDADRDRYRALGARGVIPKPFDPRTLADALRTILEDAP